MSADGGAILDGIAGPLGLRPGVEADAPVLAAFAKRTFEAAFGGDNHPQEMRRYVAEAFSTARIRKELAGQRSIFLLAFLKGSLMGYAKLCWDDKTPACVTGEKPVRLERIYIDRIYSRRGYGSRLLEACVHMAREYDRRTVWLGVWEENKKAWRFYRKHGFSDVGTTTFTLGRDVQTDRVLQRVL